MPDPHETHREQAAAHAEAGTIGFAALTVSDTRTTDDDISGDLIVSLLEERGYALRQRAIVRDEPSDIDRTLRQWIDDPDIRIVLTTGGTGVSRRDTTVEVVRHLIVKELEGFGELFRMLSFEKIRSAAMLSRAVAGLAVSAAGADGDTFLFAMPGSPAAVELAVTRLVLPEIPHLVWQRRSGP